MAPSKKKPSKLTNKPEKEASDKAGKSSTSNSKTFYRAPLKNISLNIVKQFDRFQHNGLIGCNFQRSGEHVLISRLKNFDTFHNYSDFDKRVTAISWYPKRLFFVAGSKSGDLSMLTYKNSSFTSINNWDGEGPGLSILNIHFPDLFENKMLTASIDGTVRLWDLVKLINKPEKTLLSTGTIERWYCSVSTSLSTGLTIAGDTKGVLTLMDKDLKVISKEKIHSNKVNSAEFNKKDNWLFATASVDKYVKLFDVRNLAKPIEKMLHEKGINSAYFSNNSQKLLTTDQNDEIRIYEGPVWENILTIDHPHRQFMYLTPIRATWHPQSDLIVVGRYPDPKRSNYMKGELCTVDIFNDMGELKCQLFSSSCKGILSLNEFSPGGEFMASAMGLCIPIWRYRDPSDIKSNTKHDRRSGNDDDDDDNNNDNNDDSSPKAKKKRYKQKTKGQSENCYKKGGGKSKSGKGT